MLNKVLPEEVGVNSRNVYNMISALLKRKVRMHSLLLMRGNDVFLDCYWKPFNENKTHRMYSVTKSFVSVAVGLAIDDGLIDLDAPISSYFADKITVDIGDWLSNQTVREMLTMTTICSQHAWFSANITDRTAFYFNDHIEKRPAGTLWEYDSNGSQVLSSLVERVTGKKLFDYLNERIFTHIGGFNNARILSTPNGDSWGDSAMICTPHDLALFARFVMNYGVWDGKKLISEDYLRTATSKIVDNSIDGNFGVFRHGYGYQFWRTENNGFAFVGMGDQLAICIPDKDLIMVCTADNQGCPWCREYIVSSFMDEIVGNINASPIYENTDWNKKLNDLTENLLLHYASGMKDSQFRHKINSVRYICNQNPLGWENFTLIFDSDSSGELHYTNQRGEMVLPFYVNKNRFGKFPELGYSKDVGGSRTTDGHKYNDAVSLAWLQENKLLLYTQIIDDYFGNLSMIFSFKDELAAVSVSHAAEDFMWDYTGELTAKADK